MTPCKLVYSFQHLEDLVSIFSVVQVETYRARSARMLTPIHQWVRCYTHENVFLVSTTVRTPNSA